ncbi:enoyl-[acyl-carrier protein] reductase II [Arthrobacter sp. 49Tsu3.1M3]|uniref:NAD(P)H-dependent flavin oxidoreductase n=1 Tax=Arthrobacter sp. 49Tsu3.1M3 TaxID=1279029 RepID=UPI0009A5C378|nr:nitronate monooxygenase family protein [Arthrobacter sp. 49Tsu3.1M3]SKB44008.1 enoyl-[acyl-carrier protein] reductase II [Arthrobacter sp. 49Tsu3.1M3]
MKTDITELLGIEHPVLSAGMARVSQADLVVAVSNAGGMGCLGGVSFMPPELQAEIRNIKSRCSKPFAVNLLLPDVLTSDEDSGWAPVRELWDSLSSADRAKLKGVEALLTKGAVRDQIEVVIDEAPAVIILTFATPRDFIARCHSRGILVGALTGSIGGARKAEEAGADFVIGQGTEGGGHTGHVGTMALIPGIVDAVSIPVLAAGGISDGRGLAAALALGASGVWMGTRFIASEEAYGHDAFKQRVVDGQSKDTVLTRSYTGKPLRAFRNDWTAAWEDRTGEIQGFPGQYAVAGPLVETGYQDGDMAQGMMPAGQGIQTVTEILPAGRIVTDMVAQAESLLKRLAR